MEDFLQFLEAHKDTLHIVIGAVLAILGGLVATWYQVKSARKIRKDEVIAERQVEVASEAFKLINRITQYSEYTY